MAYAEKEWSFSSESPSYGAAGGMDKVLHRGVGITADSAATVEGANYFANAASRIPDGGYAIVEAVMGIGGTVKFKQYLLARSGATMTLTLLATTAG